MHVLLIAKYVYKQLDFKQELQDSSKACFETLWELSLDSAPNFQKIAFF
jgi:hypothetical protein